MLKLAMQKECGDLLAWIKSIINHLHWCAASTPAGADREVAVAKFKSLKKHILNVHVHEDPKYPNCTHPPIQQGDRDKNWLKLSKFKA